MNTYLVAIKSITFPNNLTNELLEMWHEVENY
jgi:hypothetical protein